MPAFDAGTILSPSQRVTIADNRLVHHIADVLRVRRGESLVLFHDGALYETIVDESSKECLIVTVTAERKAPFSDRPIALVQAIIRPALLDDVVRMCVPLGANRIVMYHADRSQPWNISSRMERLGQVALSAAEQSETGFVPKLEYAEGLPAALRSLGPSHTVLCLSPTGQATIGSLVNRGTVSLMGSVAIVTGPEGGLTRQEETVIANAGGTIARLNACILRSELAGFAALASIRELQGAE